MTALLDANVLIALIVAEHVHHDAAAEWLSASDAAFATCPITQSPPPLPQGGIRPKAAITLGCRLVQ